MTLFGEIKKHTWRLVRGLVICACFTFLANLNVLTKEQVLLAVLVVIGLAFAYTVGVITEKWL